MKSPRKFPLIAMPFVIAVQTVAFVGYLVALGAFGLCCKVLDATSPPESKS